jgi:transcription initiation factor TFIID TATA-box-binding protein
MSKAKVENIVASTTLAENLDLDAVATILENAEYEPKRFPGLIFRLKKPKTALLLFRSGKVNCTGGKSIEDVQASFEIVADMLERAGIPVYKNREIVIQNMVAVYDLDCELNLNSIAISFDVGRVEYEPEQFPGLVYRLDEPKIVVLLFGSGKTVLTGAKRIEDLDVAVEKVKEDLKASGLIH